MALADKLTHSFREDEIPRKWYLLNADGQTLGRIASRAAHLLRGKHKPIFTTNVDSGDFVVVINADKVKLTGKRPVMKEYFHYTGYPGGARIQLYKDMIKKHPERVFEKAVGGMIPHTRLGRQVIKKLKVYAGPDHPHKAQQPEPIKL